MKNKITLLVASVVLSYIFLFSGVLKSDVLAGCICNYQPGYPTPAAGSAVVVGYLEEINDGGQTCADIYGPGKTGVPEGTTPTSPLAAVADPGACDVNKGVLNVGWQIPTFSQLIGNVIRLIFFVAGLFALVFLLLGGFEWVQSGGEEKKIEAARGKITASVIGLVVMIAVLSLVIFLEQVVFGGKICLGISCPMNIGFLQLIR